MVELPTLVAVAGAIHLDRSEESIGIVVDGIGHGDPGQSVDDLLLADGCGVALDGVFGDRDVHVWGCAVALLSVAAREVGVLVAAAGDGVLDDHPSAGACLVAMPAVQGALKVVVMYSSSLSGGCAGVEGGLDAVEQVLVDEWFVAPTKFFVSVGDVAEVVVVAQHPGQLADRYPLRGMPRGRTGAQPRVGIAVRIAGRG